MYKHNIHKVSIHARTALGHVRRSVFRIRDDNNYCVIIYYFSTIDPRPRHDLQRIYIGSPRDILEVLPSSSVHAAMRVTWYEKADELRKSRNVLTRLGQLLSYIFCAHSRSRPFEMDFLRGIDANDGYVYTQRLT
jgi:hypothetical protein